MMQLSIGKGVCFDTLLRKRTIFFAQGLPCAWAGGAENSTSHIGLVPFGACCAAFGPRAVGQPLRFLNRPRMVLVIRDLRQDPYWSTSICPPGGEAIAIPSQLSAGPEPP